LTSHFGFFRILDVKIEVMREKKKGKERKEYCLVGADSNVTHPHMTHVV
jgi:hypothetical protein